MRGFVGSGILAYLLLASVFAAACPVTTTSSIVITGVVAETATTSVSGNTATIQTNTASTISVTKNLDGSISVEVKAQ
mgnify:CR=1 FL=1